MLVVIWIRVILTNVGIDAGLMTPNAGTMLGWRSSDIMFKLSITSSENDDSLFVNEPAGSSRAATITYTSTARYDKIR